MKFFPFLHCIFSSASSELLKTCLPLHHGHCVLFLPDRKFIISELLSLILPSLPGNQTIQLLSVLVRVVAGDGDI
jgi:hypothetical protein